MRDVRITAIPSTHYGFFSEERYTPEEEAYYATIPAQLPAEKRDAERFIGFVLECDGLTIYHAGDNNGYHGFLERLARWPAFDLMLLPINGRDWFREQHRVIGNFTYREAAQVASAAHANLLVPYHYDGFVSNNEYPDALLRYVTSDGPRVPVRILAVGERLAIARESGGIPRVARASDFRCDAYSIHRENEIGYRVPTLRRCNATVPRKVLNDGAFRPAVRHPPRVPPRQRRQRLRRAASRV